MPEPEFGVYLTNPGTVAAVDPDHDPETVILPRRISLVLVRGQNRAQRVVASLCEFHARAEFDIKLFPPNEYLLEQERIARQALAAENGLYGRPIQGLVKEAIRCAKLVKDDPVDLAPLTDIAPATPEIQPPEKTATGSPFARLPLRALVRDGLHLHPHASRNSKATLGTVEARYARHERCLSTRGSRSRR